MSVALPAGHPRTVGTRPRLRHVLSRKVISDNPFAGSRRCCRSCDGEFHCFSGRRAGRSQRGLRRVVCTRYEKVREPDGLDTAWPLEFRALVAEPDAHYEEPTPVVRESQVQDIEDAGEDFITSIPKPCHNMLYQTTLINGAEVVAILDEEDCGQVFLNSEDGLEVKSRSRIRPVSPLPARCEALARGPRSVDHHRL